MPRRPKPVSRGGQPKIKKAPAAINSKASSNSTKPLSKPKNTPPARQNLKRPAESESEEEDGEEDQFFGSSGDEDEEDSLDDDRGEGPSRVSFGGQDMSDRDEDEDENDDDADAPRVALWEPDDEGVEDEADEEVEDELQEQPKEKATAAEKSLKNSLQDLPLGALRQAQRMLTQAAPDDESDSDSETSSDDDDDAPEAEDLKGKPRDKIEKVEWSTKRRTDIAKRSSKHAPMEVTSKRPVSRKRQVVDVPKIVARDPRFMATTGEFDTNRFSKSYAFLADSHKTELSTLKETLARARKLLSSSPRDLRAEREAEVHRLEQAVKRTESLVNRDRMQAVEREALGRVKKAERENRAQGKGEWHLKRGEKQKLVVQARYEALAKEGGQRAVKKAMEKKQKKVSQKEKRSRPYAKGEFSGGGGGQGGGDRPFKRRRI